MSSIVISGDISGTVTLDAPSTAGTTVLTLPSTSGTVVTTATTTGISGSAITTGTVGVSVGGTGANTLTANNVILGNGTSAVQFVAPGSSGNVLTSNGTTWTSAAAGGGQLQTELFTAPGTWTKPASCSLVRVTVIGGGGGGYQGNGGWAGFATANVPVSAPVAVTIGSGGTPGAGGGTPGGTGGTSSFGPFVSATGGGGGGAPSANVGGNGSGTVSTGTALKTGNVGFSNSNATNASLSVITGSLSRTPGGQVAYSTSLTHIAGARGAGNPPMAGGAAGGVGGAVLVEFVG